MSMTKLEIAETIRMCVRHVDRREPHSPTYPGPEVLAFCDAWIAELEAAEQEKPPAFVPDEPKRPPAYGEMAERLADRMDSFDHRVGTLSRDLDSQAFALKELVRSRDARIKLAADIANENRGSLDLVAKQIADLQEKAEPPGCGPDEPTDDDQEKRLLTLSQRLAKVRDEVQHLESDVSPRLDALDRQVENSRVFARSLNDKIQRTEEWAEMIRNWLADNEVIFELVRTVSNKHPIPRIVDMAVPTEGEPCADATTNQ